MLCTVPPAPATICFERDSSRLWYRRPSVTCSTIDASIGARGKPKLLPRRSVPESALSASVGLTFPGVRKIMKSLRVLEFALNRSLRGADDSYEGFDLWG